MIVLPQQHFAKRSLGWLKKEELGAAPGVDGREEVGLRVGVVALTGVPVLEGSWLAIGVISVPISLMETDLAVEGSGTNAVALWIETHESWRLKLTAKNATMISKFVLLKCHRLLSVNHSPIRDLRDMFCGHLQVAMSIMTSLSWSHPLPALRSRPVGCRACNPLLCIVPFGRGRFRKRCDRNSLCPLRLLKLKRRRCCDHSIKPTTITIQILRPKPRSDQRLVLQSILNHFRGN
nr:hypothetical protein Iba_chr12fCG4320 [Ipomoea batatas]